MTGFADGLMVVMIRFAPERTAQANPERLDPPGCMATLISVAVANPRAPAGQTHCPAEQTA